MEDMTSDELADIVADLTDDGDTVELEDGRTLRLVLEPDMDADIRDFDCHGSFSQHGYDHGDDSGRTRPDGMTGNAEKLQCDRGSFVWWEPPADGPRRGTAEFDEMRAGIRDLLETGYVGIIVELLRPESDSDAYGARIVDNVASLWGCDTVYPEAVADLVSEVLS